MLLLGRYEIQELISMQEALQAVESAFRLGAEGKASMPPKLYLDLPEHGGDFRAMPAYINGSVGVKWVGVFPNNKQRGLPAVTATIILCDPHNGYPLAIMDGTYITSLRTGAAGGLAVKYLARKDAYIIGMIGAGMQAETQLLAINEVLPMIRQVKVFDESWDFSLRYAKRMDRKLDTNVVAVRAIEEATNADILVTTTPSRKPIIMKQYVRQGTHINAIGADARGKQELETDLIMSAKVLVDDFAQASHSGEINVPISQNVMTSQNIYGTIGEVIAGTKLGRQNAKEITIFDSTGLAIQDIICAQIVYAKAIEKRMPVYEQL